MPYLLGIDSSTQSSSAIVIDTDLKKIVAEVSVNFGERLPKYNSPSGFIPNGPAGEVHSDPLMWMDALELLLEDLSHICDLSKIAAISGAGQQHGSIYLNKLWPEVVTNLETDSTLADQIRPCLSRSTSPIWMDGSTSSECQEIATAVGGNATVCSKSGSVAIERFTGPQIRRFYKNDQLAYENTARIHLVSSFLCSILCGNDAPIDTGDGAGMNLLNIISWDWDAELLDATAPGLFSKLPDIVDGITTVGYLAPYFSKKFGFKADIPITVFTGDNPSSLVGMGASQPGKVVISLGTSDTFFAAMPNVVADPNGFGHVFGNPAGGSMSLQCFQNGSLAREAVKDTFNYDWDAFTAAINSTPAGNEGNVMLPFFSPEISPRLALKEPMLAGTDTFVNWEEPDAAIRACVEGQFVNMKLRSDWMHLQTDVIYLTGGASKNDAIAQVVADVFQAKVQRLVVSGSVALGAAMRAANDRFGPCLEELSCNFCKPLVDSTIEPQTKVDTYYQTGKQITQMLDSVGSF